MPRPDLLETFANPYPDRDYEIHMDCHEFTSLCPLGFMLVFSGAVSRFVDKHPTVKMLALSFLLLIGVSLVAESLEFHIPKGYIYFAMAFSLFVEVINIKVRKSKQPPVHLHAAYTEEKVSPG